MIIERLVFKAKFGQGDGVVRAFTDEWPKLAQRYGVPTFRVLVDASGPMFTVVVETEFRDMAHVAESQAQEQQLYGEPEFQEWFGRWMPLVEHGSREYLRVVS